VKSVTTVIARPNGGVDVFNLIQEEIVDVFDEF